MATQIFVNLPVKNLSASIEFFTKLGFQFNQHFTDENATCMIVSDTIYVMLLVEPFFQGFTTKAMVDATRNTEVIVTLSVDDRETVDILVDKALAAGGQPLKEIQNPELMYARNFQDLDGHHWEVLYMDPAAVHPEPTTVAAAV